MIKSTPHYDKPSKGIASFGILSLLYLGLSTLTQAKGPRPIDLGAVDLPIGAESVVWYSTWDTAKKEAKRSNRPIFFMAASHQCGSVSGTF